MATANTRATDSNRVDTCQLLDLALSDGQLSMEEHRQRVSAATNATTLGELQSLVSDLQIRRAAAQFPNLKSLAADRRVRIAVLLVVALLGVGIAWGLYGATRGSTPDRPQSPAANPVVVAPQPPTEAPSVAPPQSSTPPPATEQLMTVGGLSDVVAQIRTKFGDTIGYELLVYPERASIIRPDSVNAHKTVEFSYANGLWSSSSSASKPMDTTVGDIGKFDVQAVISALRAAPQTLHIDGGHPDYISIQAAEDGTLRIELYVNNGYTGRYLMVNADGSVRPDF
ncbi:DUF1707 domain-containing protein [Mycobacterium sp. 1081908.1]|uniref:DUF1707 SHOCT-like domain-containing protein n=1 Tax=Mycobacterium sp. 1081908.1 TaxID=1834066 RepID=UPI00080004FB|nr:DUF1707 domain-containing protein [Mycobacterium sp. 1081908.1]OBK43260.1 hypothetical protein A5655_17005 [Mycobacterium sp. 1081908.1]